MARTRLNSFISPSFRGPLASHRYRYVLNRDQLASVQNVVHLVFHQITAGVVRSTSLDHRVLPHQSS